MWIPSEKFLVRYHIATSAATLVCGICIGVICFSPSLCPEVYQLLVDERISMIIPYLLFIAVAESVFSIWYFLIRGRLDRHGG